MTVEGGYCGGRRNEVKKQQPQYLKKETASQSSILLEALSSRSSICECNVSVFRRTSFNLPRLAVEVARFLTWMYFEKEI
jgi:hypothetical protein